MRAPWWRNPEGIQIFIVFIGAIGLHLTSWNHFFFGDTLQLASRHAHHFYKHGLGAWILPESMDSGHMPVFGWYISLVWKIFGKSLWISHAAMLPWILCNLWLFLRLFPSSKWKPVWITLLLYSIPVYASQSLLVSPDIILVTGFFSILSGIQRKQSKYLIVGGVILGIISMRGALLLSFIILSLIIWEWRETKRILKEKFPFYLIPGLCIAIAWQLFHYYKTGWIGSHPQSPWAAAFQHPEDFMGIARQAVVFLWRICDFGYIGVWILLGITIRIVKKEFLENAFHRYVWILFSVLGMGYFSLGIYYQNLNAHRYILPLFLLGIILIFHFLNIYAQQVKWKICLLPSMILFLILGNLWSYPRKIATGWDATLGHIPFYPLLKECDSFLRKNDISKQEIGATFPLLDSEEMMYVNGYSEISFHLYDMHSSKYILYSNICNDFKDAEIDQLFTKWKLVQSWKKYPVEMYLFKRTP